MKTEIVWMFTWDQTPCKHFALIQHYEHVWKCVNAEHSDRSENNLCLHDENLVLVQVCAGLKIHVSVQLAEWSQFDSISLTFLALALRRRETKLTSRRFSMVSSQLNCNRCFVIFFSAKPDRFKSFTTLKIKGRNVFNL